MFLYRLYNKFRVIWRLKQILLVFFKAGFGMLIRKIGFHKHIHPVRRIGKKGKNVKESDLPKKFRQALETLGPVFVKFGQILSTRRDILSKEYIEELEKLQSKVLPFPFADAQVIFEKSLGKPISEVFKKFEDKPFASASLGQVYRALTYGGQKVAVKIQRPKAKERIKLDTQILMILAHLVEKYAPAARNYNLKGLVAEFARWTLNELDYRKEAANCEIFSGFFKEDPKIYGPKVYWEYSSDSVLTLEFIDGYSLGQIMGGKIKAKIDKKQIAHNIADSFIKQCFQYGFFHADPHPGNIFIIKGQKIMFLDFGMVGFLDQRTTALAANMFVAVMQKDVENIVSLLVQIEERFSDKTEDQQVHRTVKVNDLRRRLTELVIQWPASGAVGSYTQLFSRLLDVAVEGGIDVPVDMTMLGKAVTTLDVVMKELDPKFSLEKWEEPLLDEIISGKLEQKHLKSRLQNIGITAEDIIKHLPESTSRIIQNLEKSRFGMELSPHQLLEYEHLLNVNSRLNTYGVLLAAIVIASALTYNVVDQPVLWGSPLSHVGLYGGLVLIALFFISNLYKRKKYE